MTEPNIYLPYLMRIAKITLEAPGVRTFRLEFVDEAAAAQNEREVPVQVNGKLRDRISVAVDASDDEVKRVALDNDNVKKHLEGKTPLQVIYVRGRLVNIVV